MRVSDDQVSLFKSVFTGRTDVYGTYDPRTRKTWQIKRPVTDQVIRNHLEGRVPYGVYLLDRDRISAVAADFDQDDTHLPLSFQQAAQGLGLAAYVERSKSKGYHVWMFFDSAGVPAHKARLVVLHLLKRIQAPTTEVFPKQDQLDHATQYGNFINAPLFGQLVPHGRTVFLDGNLKPCSDQWAFLRMISRVSEAKLDEVIAANELNQPPLVSPARPKLDSKATGFGLSPCAQRMLAEGVTANQRVACYRLACQLRKIGLPYDLALATLTAWSQRNRPSDEKGVIKPGEVRSQTHSAYTARAYLSCGCDDPAVTPFCDPLCQIRRH